MAQHARIDAAGRLIGFYDDRLHEVLPAGTVQLTPAQYRLWLQKQRALVWDHAQAALVADPSPPPPPAPGAVWAYQFKAQLAGMPGAAEGRTLLEEVNEVATGSADPLIVLAWTYAPRFTRAGHLVAALAKTLGWSTAQLDQMFVDAAKITD